MIYIDDHDHKYVDDQDDNYHEYVDADCDHNIDNDQDQDRHQVHKDGRGSGQYCGATVTHQ